MMRNCDHMNRQSSRNCQSNDLDSLPVAMAYVPWQHFDKVYDPEQALQCGTIFPELNQPFMGKRGTCL
jgi:hypothetical protein